MGASGQLSMKHQEIIRLAFAGMKQRDIAAHVGMTEATICIILKSPLVLAELQRLTEKAEESLTNVPLRVKLLKELNAGAEEALRSNLEIMKDKSIEPRTRARVGMHLMDRVIFDQPSETEREGGYREILRRLGEVQRSLGDGVMLLPPVNGGGENGSNGNGHDHEQSSTDTGVGETPPTQE